MPLLLFFIFLFPSLCAQKSESALLFDKALKNFNLENYKAADSLYTLSNSLEPCREVYFNRAICRGKQANQSGYCQDLAQASVLGEDRATRYYARSCGKIDTFFNKLDQNNSTTTILSKVLKYHYKDSIILVHTQKYARQEGRLLDSTTNKNIQGVVETMAEFPGGPNALIKFIKQNIKVPNSLSSEEKVFLRFVVFWDGSIQDITILKKSLACTECDEEAMRLVAIMPTWKPATMGGEKVSCYFNLPISFKKKLN